MAGTYLDRAAWGALPLTRLGHLVPRAQFRRIVLHHTVIVQGDYDRDGYLHGDLDDVKRYMRSLQTARPDLGRDVPYSFVVFQGTTPDDHIVCEGRGFDRTGAHTEGMNSTTYGVSLAGDFTNITPTPGMIAGVRWVGAQITGDPLSTIAHRDTKPTACPGNRAYPLLPQMQPPFLAPPPPPPPVVPSKRRQKMFQFGDGTGAVFLWDGEKIVDLGGLPTAHVNLNSTGAALFIGHLPKGEADLLKARLGSA